jgi:MYXO-CTERM domain-containing protein
VCSGCTATDVTSSPRPQNLNPEGISFTDCEQNLRMDFSLVLSGFAAADMATVQAWAGTVDCTQDTNRVSTAGTLHACWQVAGVSGPVVAASATTLKVSVFARDVLRYEAVPATATAQAYDPTFNSSSAGESACHVQPTDAAVPIGLYFIPVNSTANAIGTAFQYSLRTDLVAPAPPCTVNAQGGSDLLDVAWTAPSADSDRVGFAVYSAPAGEAGCDAIMANTFLLGASSQPACQRQGIALVSPAVLSGTVYDPTTTSFTQTGLHGGERYAAVVASVDGSGNVGPLSSGACAQASGSGGSSTATAGCGCTSAGATSSATGALALGALGLAFVRRRRGARGGRDGAILR